MRRKKTRTIRLTWIILSIMSAFVLGLYFKPGNPSGNRMPPRLTREQMMNRMPRQMVAPRQMAAPQQMVVPRQMPRAPMNKDRMPNRQAR